MRQSFDINEMLDILGDERRNLEVAYDGQNKRSAIQTNVLS